MCDKLILSSEDGVELEWKLGKEGKLNKSITNLCFL